MIDRDYINAQKELLAHSFGYAQAYTNVVLVAGYAGFFAIWSFLKPDLTKGEVLWSALLVSLSLTSFILFEVYQSFHRSTSLLSLARVVENPSRFVELMTAHRLAENERVIRLKWVWVVAYSLSVVSAILGVLVLLWAFVRSLWALYVS